LPPENYTKLQRLYISGQKFAAGQSYPLPEGQAHYLRNVLRKSAGDHVRVFNGHDGEWLAGLEEISKKNVVIKLADKLLEQKAGPDVWVLASPLKKESFDWAVEKACELGSAKFIPLICARTVVHKINRERLQSIAIEAAEQSERLDVMTVEPLQNLKDFLNTYNYKRTLIFCIERSEALLLADIAPKQKGESLALLIGPEGGFSSDEIDFISHFECVMPVSLGSRVLKAETAIISALSLLT
jgi:16S rRNA (uracil1498-N3)-methyltransferase